MGMDIIPNIYVVIILFVRNVGCISNEPVYHYRGRTKEDAEIMVSNPAAY
jgi:hypothetical protein